MKSISENLWVHEGELLLLGVPFGVRMTVVRLVTGGLWVHSPIAWVESLREELAAIGPVECLVAPNNGHNKWLAEWHHQFPEARVFVARGTPAKRRTAGSESIVAGVSDWEPDLDSLQMPMVPLFDEVVFLHRSSRSLIVTDLIQNHAGRHLHGIAGVVDRFVLKPLGFKGVATAPPLKFPRVRKDRVAFEEFLQAILSWDFDKIIPTHGPVIEVDARATAEQALESLRHRQ